MAKGLGGISFTDHFDVEAPGDNSHFSFDPLEQQDKIDKLKSREVFLLAKVLSWGFSPVRLRVPERLSLCSSLILLLLLFTL